MNDIFIVAEKEVKSTIRKKRALGGIIYVMVLMIALPIFVFISIVNDVEAPTPEARSQVISMMLEFFVNNYCFNYTVAMTLFFTWGLAFDAFFGEKMKKTIETLLATPLTPRCILFGKTLGIFSIAYPATIITTIGFILAANLAANLSAPESISYLPNYLIWVHLFIVLPFLCFFIIGTAGAIQLIVRDFKAGNFVIFAIGFLCIFLPSIIAGRDHGLFPLKDMLLIYVALTGAMGLLMCLCMRFVTKERIVLST